MLFKTHVARSLYHFVGLFLFVLGTGSSYAENSETSAETSQQLSPWLVLTDIPKTSLSTIKESFNKKSIAPWSIIISTTALTYQYDEDILLDVQKKGRDLGLGNEDKTKTFVSAGPYDLVRLPTDTGSALYFLGDGWIHMGAAFGLFATGYYTGASRPWNTSLQLVHGMVVSTIFNQAGKRSTGRESPNQRTEPRGRWRPFPSIDAYNTRTAQYDAVPSGHIMTSTLTFTILAENYPEHKWWLYPLGGVWLTALGWQMINNGVHWASDYPLGIAMGYQIGMISTRLGRPDKKGVDAEESANEASYMFYPGQQENTPTFNLLVSF